MNLQGFSQILNVFNLYLDSLRLVGDVFWNAWNLLFKNSSIAFKEFIIMIIIAPGFCWTDGRFHKKVKVTQNIKIEDFVLSILNS